MSIVYIGTDNSQGRELLFYCLYFLLSHSSSQHLIRNKFCPYRCRQVALLSFKCTKHFGGSAPFGYQLRIVFH